MRRAKRILLMASMLLLSVGSASASWWHRSQKKASEPATAATAPTTLDAVEAASSQIVLRTSGAPAFTTLSPTPDQFVVDLSGTVKSSSLTIPSPLPAGVSAITADEVTEVGSNSTRVTVRLAQPGMAQAAVDGNSVVISLPAPPPVAVAASRPLSDPAPAAPAVTTTPEPLPVRAVEPPVKAEAIPLPKARTLRKIETVGSGAAMEVRIAMDGDAAYNAFKLESPFRVVIDLSGIKDKLPRNTIAVNGSPLKQIRAAQFSRDTTRVVLDLSEKTAWNAVKSGDQIVVTFGDAALAAAAKPPAAVPLPVKTAEVARPFQVIKADELDKGIDVATPSAASPKPADSPAQAAATPSVVAQVPTVAANATAWKMPEDPASGAVAVIHSQDQAPPPPPAPRKTTQSTTAGQPAVGMTEMSTEPQPTGPIVGGALGGSRTLSAGEKVYTGEPISLNLKDADLKDVLRTFASLTGLNIAVDPDVHGSVTVDFVDVPWDQALDLILRQNGLSYTLEGNVMRVGTLARLSEEAAANRRLAEEERLNVPMTTVSFKLSYARATDVQTLLKEIASPRAKIIVDQRTNQLIISEIPANLQTIRNLIDSVDVANRQVVIEARVVETTQTFAQQWGVNWGFRGTLDPSLGTGTGLVFPNRIDTIGGPFDFGPGNPVLQFSLANVLGTFTLDVALNALENESLARVIAAPRIQTQDNVAAQVEAGTQIPFQTRINFTTTVNYVNATLSLTVTPQITEAGTVIMDINVQKNDPGITAPNAPGPSIATRTARTKLMVRDGGTAVIAGIYQTNDTDNRSRLPFVHKIPILGNIFKTHDISSTHTELLIFITPRIVRTS